MKTDKLILDACCGPRMMWFDKRNPQAVFMDIRDEEHILCDGRSLEVHPDVIGDFRSIPFEDATFRLVVFDPPHLVRLGDNSYMAHKYGKLLSTWETDLKQGFDECMRVLKPEVTGVRGDVEFHAVLSVACQRPTGVVQRHAHTRHIQELQGIGNA